MTRNIRATGIDQKGRYMPELRCEAVALAPAQIVERAKPATKTLTQRDLRLRVCANQALIPILKIGPTGLHLGLHS